MLVIHQRKGIGDTQKEDPHRNMHRQNQLMWTALTPCLTCSLRVCSFIFWQKFICPVLHDHLLQRLCSVWFCLSPSAELESFINRSSFFCLDCTSGLPLAAARWGGCGSTRLASLLSGSLSYRSKLSLCYDRGCTVAFTKQPWHATLANISSLPAKETDDHSSEQAEAVCVPDAPSNPLKLKGITR